MSFFIGNRTRKMKEKKKKKMKNRKNHGLWVGPEDNVGENLIPTRRRSGPLVGVGGGPID